MSPKFLTDFVACVARRRRPHLAMWPSVRRHWRMMRPIGPRPQPARPALPRRTRANLTFYLGMSASANTPMGRRRLGLLHRFDQVTAASHSGPCLVEVGNKHLKSGGVETVAQGCHVPELVERIVDRWVAAAPEAPAFLGTEFIH